MLLNDAPQGSEAWHLARAGKVTASRISDLMAKGKNGPSASRETYMGQLIAELLTGTISDGFTTTSMTHGIETEAQARAAYSFYTDRDVQEVGFVLHPVMPDRAGASPDGIIGDDGLLEVKSPNTATHINTLLTGKIPSKYLLQMTFQMICTERAWCDFVSFDPRMPADLQIFIKRVHWDRELVSEINAEVSKFLNDMDAKIAQLSKLREAA